MEHCTTMLMTTPYHMQEYNTLINVLEKESSILIEWFNFKCMQANPNKFQAIAVGKNTYAKEPVFNSESANISCDESLKFIWVGLHTLKIKPFN
jgi:hypothetical protein